MFKLGSLSHTAAWPICVDQRLGAEGLRVAVAAIGRLVVRPAVAVSIWVRGCGALRFVCRDQCLGAALLYVTLLVPLQELRLPPGCSMHI